MITLPSHYAEVEAVYSQTLGANYRTIAITSAAPGEGKSTLAEALVKRAQASDKKVLLVELNTFNPVLKARLQEAVNAPMPTQKSTSQVAQNQVAQSQIGAGIINLNEQGYSVLPVSNDAMTIKKYREASLLIEAINQWLSEFDCIVFDTASLAMLNQHNIPACTVCQVCDGAIMVVEAGKTPANLIEEGIEKLVAKQVNIVGTVVNDKSNPSLLDEMIRESHKLDAWLPKMMSKLRAKLANVVMLNVAV
ncbi:hypothetical protein [Thalassotalea montiporae]